MHVYLSHARRHGHAVATVRMHAHAWVPCEAALCAHCPTSLSIPGQSQSMPVLNQYARGSMVGFAVIDKERFWLLVTDTGAQREVMKLSGIKDVDAELQCEGMICMDKIKTSIQDFQCQVEHSQGVENH